MALIWIVTTGNSDVKLNSDEGWKHLRTKNNKQLEPCSKKFCALIRGNDNLWSLPARVIGIVYGDAWNTHQNYFRFPLLEEFTRKLKDDNQNPDRIIVLLTNQEKVFVEDSDRTEDSPYWRDTYRLKPILQHYFDREFGENKVEFIPLEPKNREEGLDNWDSTLELVQIKCKELGISKNDSLIVSHQASTPAISSAVQFVSLANFGERVDFLISNERDPELTRFLDGSKYLKGIRKREAETLLERHDYSGVEALISDYIKNDKDTQILLEAAIQWNFAKFDNFADEIQKLSDSKFKDLVQQLQERKQHWWWKAYESAYLAIIRLEIQKDTVDALFHSFRAIEGIFTEWGIYNLRDHIEIENGRPYLKMTILDEERYFQRAKYKEKEGKQVPDNDIAKLKSNFEEIKTKNKKKPVFYGFIVYTLFREIRQEWKNKCKTISRFWDSNNGISEKRNKIFHQLHGLTDSELFEIWEVNSLDDWKVRIKEYANFVSEETFESLDRESIDGTVASLIQKVHQALKKEIADL